MSKYITISLLFGLLLLGCKPKVEFYIDGKPYSTSERCIESITEVNFDLNLVNGTMPYYVPVMTERCLNYAIDTIEIKQP